MSMQNARVVTVSRRIVTIKPRATPAFCSSSSALHHPHAADSITPPQSIQLVDIFHNFRRRRLRIRASFYTSCE